MHACPLLLCCCCTGPGKTEGQSTDGLTQWPPQQVICRNSRAVDRAGAASACSGRIVQTVLAAVPATRLEAQLVVVFALAAAVGPCGIRC